MFEWFAAVVDVFRWTRAIWRCVSRRHCSTPVFSGGRAKDDQDGRRGDVERAWRSWVRRTWRSSRQHTSVWRRWFSAPRTCSRSDQNYTAIDVLTIDVSFMFSELSIFFSVYIDWVVWLSWYCECVNCLCHGMWWLFVFFLCTSCMIYINKKNNNRCVKWSDI